MSDTKALRWVKASERLPELPIPLPPNTPEERGILFINRAHSAANFWYPSYGFPAKDFFIPFSNKTLYDDGWGIENWEWLDESGCIPNRVRKTEMFEHSLKLAQNYERDHPSAGTPIPENHSKEKEEAGIPEDIPKMSFELGGMSDVAAIEYGKICDHFISSRSYDNSHITETHEQGQIWMYRKLQEEFAKLLEQLGKRHGEQIDSLKAEIAQEKNNFDVMVGNDTRQKASIENLMAERDAALKEVEDYRTALQNAEAMIIKFGLAGTDNFIHEILAKHKKEEHP